jgi:signal transduction histidine kinase
LITSGLSAGQRAELGPHPRNHGVLGLLMRSAMPVRVADVSAHPLARGFPPGHPVMRNLVGAPVRLHGQSLGNLYVAEKDGGGDFSEDDERLLMVLACHAAVAIDNTGREHHAGEAIERRLGALAQSNAQLQKLTALVIDAQEDERRRIARDLHDGTAQALTTVLVQLRLLARAAESDAMRTGLLETLELTTAILDGVRLIARDLRPSTLDDLGLVPAVESYAHEFGERWAIEVSTSVTGIRDRLDRDQEVVLYRIIQEALTNVARHASATRVEIDLREDTGRVIASVHDNGVGFVPPGPTDPEDRRLGLLGMQERAQLAGGHVEIRSAPGDGATVTAVVPVRRSEEPG